MNTQIKHCATFGAAILIVAALTAGCDLRQGLAVAGNHRGADPHARHGHENEDLEHSAGLHSECAGDAACGAETGTDTGNKPSNGHGHRDEHGQVERSGDEHKDHIHGAEAHAECAADAACGGEPGVLWCAAHDLPELECAACQPHRLAQLKTGQGLMLRLASVDVAAQAGIEFAAPSIGGVAEQLRVLGEVGFNENELAVVTPLGGGVVQEVLADVGDEVAPGQVLAVVNAPAVAEARSALLKAQAEAELARQAYAREQDLLDREITARQDYEQARAAWAAARSEVSHAEQHLLNLGLTTEEVEAVARGEALSSRLAVRAPLSGVVVTRDVVPGTAVQAGTPLFEVAGLEAMWMNLSIPESRLVDVRHGSPVTAQFEAYPGRDFKGELTWLAPRVNPQTRTVEARAELMNPDRLLKAGMFGEAILEAGASVQAPMVPRDAAHEVDGRTVVFARLDEDLFEVRLVDVVDAGQGRIAITDGVEPDEPVAVAGGYMLKSEMLKARLGAGCGGH